VHLAHTGYDSISVLLQPRTLAITIALSIVSWFFECFGYWLVLNVFDATPSILKATFIYAFSTIIGAVSMLPGGLGTTEGSLTGLSILTGVPRDIAVASTFIIRVATLWFAVIVGVIVTFAFQHVLKVRIEDLDLTSLNKEQP
jgi:glycosyltransferase 2 family protein